MKHLDSANREHEHLKFCGAEYFTALFWSDSELVFYCIMFESGKRKIKQNVYILLKEKRIP